MNNHLNLNVLQDFVDINGRTFKLKIKWQKGNIYIDQGEEVEGGVVHFTQLPLSPITDRKIRDDVLIKMTGVSKVTINKSLAVTQKIKQPNVIDLQNKFKQSMDFEMELNSNRPAKIKVFTYFGIQRLEHDYTYTRALFTTNPYFATIFNGIRIVPYERDIEELGDKVIQTVKEYAQDILSKGYKEETELHFKVEKAFEITFYLDKQEVTQDIHLIMNKKKENQTTLDEFGFIAYIAFYQLFDGELNNHIALNQL